MRSSALLFSGSIIVPTSTGPDDHLPGGAAGSPWRTFLAPRFAQTNGEWVSSDDKIVVRIVVRSAHLAVSPPTKSPDGAPCH